MAGQTSHILLSDNPQGDNPQLVTQANPLPIQLIDEAGEPLHTFAGGLDVHIADAHDRVVNEFFYNHSTTTTTLASNVSAQATSIPVVSATGFSVGDSLDLANGTVQEQTHPEITNISGTTFDLDRPLDSSFSAGDNITKITRNMAVDGSSTPVSFKLAPHIAEDWHILRLLISMIHSSSADDSKLGNITALTNGILFRKYDGLTSSYTTYTNWKSNADLVSDMYDITYGDKAGGGAFSTKGRFSLKNATEAVPKINQENGDYLEMLVQDNLTGLTSLVIKAQGHVAGH